jgi:hypothetical protein
VGDKSGGCEADKDDAFADTLTCIICQELLHDCIRLVGVIFFFIRIHSLFSFFSFSLLDLCE